MFTIAAEIALGIFLANLIGWMIVGFLYVVGMPIATLIGRLRFGQTRTPYVSSAPEEFPEFY